MNTTTGNKQAKKETREELERRMRNAVVLIPRDKEFKSIWFDDKGLRLTKTSDYAIVETLFHRHIFNALNGNGYSMPYLYVCKFIDIAYINDCETKDASGAPTHSYAKLFESLQKKDEKTEYNICWYVDKWLYNIFQPLYSIDDTRVSNFLVYESYMHSIARNHVILDEKKEDVTNGDFIDKVYDMERSYIDGTEVENGILFEKITDEQLKEQEAKAIQEEIENNMLKEQQEEEGE